LEAPTELTITGSPPSVGDGYHIALADTSAAQHVDNGGGEVRIGCRNLALKRPRIRGDLTRLGTEERGLEWIRR
jgi:hypothetical protein